MVAILYIVGAPAGDADDVTRRALRILRDAAVVVADDGGLARRLLASHDIPTPLVAASDVNALLDTLETADVALLTPGWPSDSSGPGQRLVRAAIERGVPIAAVPGPSLPITALVISGLPADSFVYLGNLPPSEPLAFPRQALLAAIASERRTLVLLESLDRLPGTLADLHDALGARPLAIVAASAQGTRVLWRGHLGALSPGVLETFPKASLALIVGGARAQPIPWDEDRLRAKIQAYLSQGLGAKEISRQLATTASWPRREIYRLAVEIARRDFSSQ